MQTFKMQYVREAYLTTYSCVFDFVTVAIEFNVKI